MSILELLQYAKKSFADADVENPQKNAEILLSYLLNCSSGEIYLKENPLIDSNRLDSLIQQRINNEPWAYIFNSVQFRNLELNIKKGVFIPRPETEILAEETIRKVKSQQSKVKSILELGTGCGNIAISLAKTFPSVLVTTADISKTALKIAKINARRYNLKNIRFLYSDLYKNIPRQKFDIVVSNPPYVPVSSLKTLAPEVRKEPRLALNGGKKGVFILQKIIKSTASFLKKEGYLFLEIGICQDDLLKKIIAQSKLKLIKIVKDYQGIPRVTILRKKQKVESNK
ncbi:MAG: peptide chain release factor N(5)-glutamine methyltransferase [Candidatus Omnitrophica bacterium]|nr:peptide chain release factor N(5)-glutamine methyltransferase [Candidatus Omnitrophota bacterium]